MTADTAEREAFEKWWGEDDDYFDGREIAWGAWQVRARLPARAPEGRTMASDLIERLRDGICVRDAATFGIMTDLDATVRLMKQAADALAAQAAEIEQLKAAVFGGPGFDQTLRIGNFVEMARATEAARQGALARADALAARVEELEGIAKRLADTSEALLRYTNPNNVPEDHGRQWLGVFDQIERTRTALHPKTPAPAAEGGAS